MERFEDVVVAGAGPAGACAAAALSALGYGVLLVEPGLKHERRLAGELLHPPAVRNLRALGLGEVLTDAGAQSLEGFAIFHGEGGAERRVLPYGADGERGATAEHSAMLEALLARARSLPGVTVLDGARVGSVSHGHDRVTVTIAGRETRQTVHARLLVAADGRGSAVRRMAGIDATRVTHSTMAGYVVETDTLPQPRHGHVFTDGRTPVLAYGIAPGRVRVMMDVGAEGRDVASTAREPGRLAALPEPFRAAVARTVAAARPLVAANVTIRPEVVARGRVALVGDAAGCCHPVSASGIASSTHDARALAAAVQDVPGDLPRALQAYAARRRGPHTTRIALATALYRAFAEPSPEMTLLRRGLFAYWDRSAGGRAASMALLSTADDSIASMAREYARVVGYALPSLSAVEPRRDALVGLLRSALPYAGDAVRESFALLARHPSA